MSNTTVNQHSDLRRQLEQASDQRFGIILRQAALTATVIVAVLAFYPLTEAEVMHSGEPELQPVARQIVPLPLAPLAIQERPPVTPPAIVAVSQYDELARIQTVTERQQKVPVAKSSVPITIVQRPKADTLPHRTREEIEQVFTHNKQVISELYNEALRREPKLKGLLVLKMTIVPSGEVTDCEVVSSEFADEELLRNLVDRVRRFRFENKKVAPITTVKPIDFYPA